MKTARRLLQTISISKHIVLAAAVLVTVGRCPVFGIEVPYRHCRHAVRGAVGGAIGAGLHQFGYCAYGPIHSTWRPS